jgi:predicted O-methyltransferase YrrM
MAGYVNTLVEGIRTAAWLIQRPSHWAHARELVLRMFDYSRNPSAEAKRARAWASDRAVSLTDALKAVGLGDAATTTPRIPEEIVTQAMQRMAQVPIKMGGPGDINLLYAATKLLGARRVIETGVAYGWSSLAILAALDGQDGGHLTSVDMPYPAMNNEPWIGVVVPDSLRKNWNIICEPDRSGLEKAIAGFGGIIDLCHYDSDKSYRGRRYAYPRLWAALAPGGIFISDDIQDNMAFAEFVEMRHLPYAVTEFEGKFVGLTRREQASEFARSKPL